ncbi:MAG: hypothetical protein AAFX54_03190 [Pseudomonadota bacterium]
MKSSLRFLATGVAVALYASTSAALQEPGFNSKNNIYIRNCSWVEIGVTALRQSRENNVVSRTTLKKYKLFVTSGDVATLRVSIGPSTQEFANPGAGYYTLNASRNENSAIWRFTLKEKSSCGGMG